MEATRCGFLHFGLRGRCVEGRYRKNLPLPDDAAGVGADLVYPLGTPAHPSQSLSPRVDCSLAETCRGNALEGLRAYRLGRFFHIEPWAQSEIDQLHGSPVAAFVCSTLDSLYTRLSAHLHDPLAICFGVEDH